jgi:hypothetical protein
MIRWRAAGIESGTAGAVVVRDGRRIFAIGRPLLDRLGANGAALLAAAAGVLRWTLSAETAALPALALSQPLHGLSFALLHLACMRRLAEIVPPQLSATALILYGTVGIGGRQRGADPGLGRALRRRRGRGLLGHSGAVRRRIADCTEVVKLVGTVGSDIRNAGRITPGWRPGAVGSPNFLRKGLSRKRRNSPGSARHCTSDRAARDVPTQTSSAGGARTPERSRHRHRIECGSVCPNPYIPPTPWGGQFK